MTANTHLTDNNVGSYASEILTALLTVDGASSGLDADLLDGNEASAFALSGHNHDSTYVNVTGDTMTGALVIADGTALAPGLALASDTDTGLYYKGVGELGISVGGVLRGFWTDSHAIATGPALVAGTSDNLTAHSVLAPAGVASYDASNNLVASLSGYGGTTGLLVLGVGANATSIVAGGTTGLSLGVVGSGIAEMTGARFHTNVDGTAAAPVITVGETDTGLYNLGIDQLGVSTAGTLRLDVSTTAITSTLPYLAPSGSAGAPSLAFSGDTDTGIYLMSDGGMAFSTAGVVRGFFTDLHTLGLPALVIGTAMSGVSNLTMASIGFMVYNSTNQSVISAFDFGGSIFQLKDSTGVDGVQLTGRSDGLTITGIGSAPADLHLTRVRLGVGSEADPAVELGETGTGFWRGLANIACLSLGGARHYQWQTTTFQPATDSTHTLGTSANHWSDTFTDRIQTDNGAAATPAYTFDADDNTGLYSVGADNLGISTNGVLRLDVSTTALTFSDAFNIVVGTTTGTQIGTATTQKLGFYGATPVVRPAAYTPSNVTTDRTYDANSTTLDEVADVLGTLIADLQALGLIG